MTRSVWYRALGVGMALCGAAAFAQDPGYIDPDKKELSAEAKLGKRLFSDTRLSDRGSQFEASCASCHIPEQVHGNERAFADEQPKSLLPSSSQGRKKTTERNTPTLIDIAGAERFNWDGEYGSLEALIRAKVLSRAFGWEADERERGLTEVHRILTLDTGEQPGVEQTYPEAFQDAMGVAIGDLSPEALYEQVVQALTAYVTSIESDHSSPLDAWAYLNRINKEKAANEEPADFAGRLFGNLFNLEGRMLVKFPQGYDEEAYQGLKIFYRTTPHIDNDNRVGNCVACHYPPDFTDYEFHNVGVTQLEYDAEHGDGAFRAFELPKDRKGSGGAEGPDLGYWHHADPETSPFREDGESAEAFLERMVGAFKTPTLRNIGKTDPYMHNGAYETLEEVIRQKIRISEMAKAGELRNPDPAYLDMNLSEDDIEPLVKFLKTFDDVGLENYRELIVEDVKTREEGPAL